jgi:hypothetical protein
MKPAMLEKARQTPRRQGILIHVGDDGREEPLGVVVGVEERCPSTL